MAETTHLNGEIFDEHLNAFFEKVYPYLVELRDNGIKKCLIFYDGNKQMTISSSKEKVWVYDSTIPSYKELDRILSSVLVDDRMNLENLVISYRISKYGMKLFNLKWDCVFPFDEAVRLFDEYVTPHLVELARTSNKCSIFLSGGFIKIKSGKYVKYATNSTNLVDWHLFGNILRNIDLGSRMDVKSVKVSKQQTESSIMFFELSW